MPLVEDVFAKGIAAHFTTSYDTAAVKGLELEQTTRAVLDIHISPIFGFQGKVTHTIIQHIDITRTVSGRRRGAARE